MFRHCAVVAILVTSLAVTTFADMKAKSRMSMGQAGGMSFDSTNYVKGARERREMNMMGMQQVQIYQCDLKRMALINEKNRTYMITELGDMEESSTDSAPAQKSSKTSSSSSSSGPGGVLTITANATDTGERKDFFGYKARHVKTDMKMESSADAKCGANMEMKTDGWYIDFKEQQMICSTNPRAQMAGRGDGGGAGCPDKVRVKGSGFARMGYPVSTEMTMISNGQPMTMKMETLELSTANLDPSLFEIPPGYKQVYSYKDLMGFGGIINAAKAAGSMAAAMGSAAASAGATNASSPKAAGKLRVGVVGFANSSGAAVPETTLRDGLVSEIAQLDMEAVALDVSPSAQLTEIDQAAKQANCDYYVTTDIAQAKNETASAAGKKAFGGFLSRATGIDTSSSTKNGGFMIGTTYKLYAVGDEKVHLEGAESSNEGSSPEATAAPLLEREALKVGVQVKTDAEWKRRGVNPRK